MTFMQTKIIYEDSAIIVIYKPAGLAAQSAHIAKPDVMSELNNYLAEKSGKSQPCLRLIHRLDQPVEGLLVFAKNEKSAADLSAQLSGENKNFQKTYKAVVYLEHLSEKAKENQAAASPKAPIMLTDYLIKDGRAKLAKIVPKNTPRAKKAVLSYEVLAKKEGLALLAVHLHTGRFHQIRAQLSHAGMPILGDLKYGTENSKQVSQKNDVQTVALCACELGFVHPQTKKPITYKVTPQNRIFEVFNS